MDKPSKQELEANIKISHNWLTAVKSGTFSGGVSLHIATLLDFLQKQHDESLRSFETESLTHPDWKKPALSGIS